MRQARLIYLILIMTAVLIFGSPGCGRPEPGTAADIRKEGQEVLSWRSDDVAVVEAKTASSGSYQAPDFADAVFHADKAEGDGSVQLDLSSSELGYIGVQAVSDHRLKFQVMKDDTTYTYDVSSDGTPSFFPLQCGNGSYSFRMMENVTGTKYAELYSTTCDVKLKDEYEPFIRPSDYVSYKKDSDCTKEAAKISAASKDEMEVVQGVYDYICNHVTYDKAKAKNIKKGYMPEPDETMKSGKGICFDYASLAAAMLRSQGIPTKVVFGYVAPKDLYHAWNMFYTDETGWVTVNYEVKGDDWNRLDLTFAANGADGDFIGDGSNYTDVYYY